MDRLTIARRQTETAAQLARLALLAVCIGSLFAMSGCVNYATVEIAHTSHPLAGPPFGDRAEEDSLDRLNTCVGQDRGGWYTEACVGYKLKDGGFYGPKVTFDARIGRRFSFGERR